MQKRFLSSEANKNVDHKLKNADHLLTYVDHKLKNVDHKLKPHLVVVGRVAAYDLPSFPLFYSAKCPWEGWSLWSTSLSLWSTTFELMIYHVWAYDLPIFPILQKEAFFTKIR